MYQNVNIDDYYYFDYCYYVYVVFFFFFQINMKNASLKCGKLIIKVIKQFECISASMDSLIFENV